MSFSAVWWLTWLPLGPRFSGSSPAEDDEFLRTIKIPSTTSFGEVNPSVLYRKIYGMLKNPGGIKEILHRQNGHFSASLSCFATKCLLLITARELWRMNLE
jgi:hypothetical protein